MPTLKVAKADEELALRLLIALVQHWDSFPLATQSVAIRQAGDGTATAFTAQLMGFIMLHKRASGS